MSEAIETTITHAGKNPFPMTRIYADAAKRAARLFSTLDDIATQTGLYPDEMQRDIVKVIRDSLREREKAERRRQSAAPAAKRKQAETGLT